MIQIEYRNGFCVIDGGKISYYKMRDGVLKAGVSGKMARALGRLVEELALKELKSEP